MANSGRASPATPRSRSRSSSAALAGRRSGTLSRDFLSASGPRALLESLVGTDAIDNVRRGAAYGPASSDWDRLFSFDVWSMTPRDVTERLTELELNDKGSSGEKLRRLEIAQQLHELCFTFDIAYLDTIEDLYTRRILPHDLFSRSMHEVAQGAQSPASPKVDRVMREAVAKLSELEQRACVCALELVARLRNTLVPLLEEGADDAEDADLRDAADESSAGGAQTSAAGFADAQLFAAVRQIICDVRKPQFWQPNVDIALNRDVERDLGYTPDMPLDKSCPMAELIERMEKIGCNHEAYSRSEHLLRRNMIALFAKYKAMRRARSQRRRTIDSKGDSSGVAAVTSASGADGAGHGAAGGSAGAAAPGVPVRADEVDQLPPGRVFELVTQLRLAAPASVPATRAGLFPRDLRFYDAAVEALTLHVRALEDRRAPTGAGTGAGSASESADAAGTERTVREGSAVQRAHAEIAHHALPPHDAVVMIMHSETVVHEVDAGFGERFVEMGIRMDGHFTVREARSQSGRFYANRLLTLQWRPAAAADAGGLPLRELLADLHATYPRLALALAPEGDSQAHELVEVLWEPLRVLSAPSDTVAIPVAASVGTTPRPFLRVAVLGNLSHGAAEACERAASNGVRFREDAAALAALLRFRHWDTSDAGQGSAGSHGHGSFARRFRGAAAVLFHASASAREYLAPGATAACAAHWTRVLDVSNVHDSALVTEAKQELLSLLVSDGSAGHCVVATPSHARAMRQLACRRAACPWRDIAVESANLSAALGALAALRDDASLALACVWPAGRLAPLDVARLVDRTAGGALRIVLVATPAVLHALHVTGKGASASVRRVRSLEHAAASRVAPYDGASPVGAAVLVAARRFATNPEALRIATGGDEAYERAKAEAAERGAWPERLTEWRAACAQSASNGTSSGAESYAVLVASDNAVVRRVLGEMARTRLLDCAACDPDASLRALASRLGPDDLVCCLNAQLLSAPQRAHAAALAHGRFALALVSTADDPEAMRAGGLRARRIAACDAPLPARVLSGVIEDAVAAAAKASRAVAGAAEQHGAPAIASVAAPVLRALTLLLGHGAGVSLARPVVEACACALGAADACGGSLEMLAASAADAARALAASVAHECGLPDEAKDALGSACVVTLAIATQRAVAGELVPAAAVAAVLDTTSAPAALVDAAAACSVSHATGRCRLAAWLALAVMDYVAEAQVGADVTLAVFTDACTSGASLLPQVHRTELYVRSVLLGGAAPAHLHLVSCVGGEVVRNVDSRVLLGVALGSSVGTPSHAAPPDDSVDDAEALRLRLVQRGELDWAALSRAWARFPHGAEVLLTLLTAAPHARLKLLASVGVPSLAPLFAALARRCGPSRGAIEDASGEGVRGDSESVVAGDGSPAHVLAAAVRDVCDDTAMQLLGEAAPHVRAALRHALLASGAAPTHVVGFTSDDMERLQEAHVAVGASAEALLPLLVALDGPADVLFAQTGVRQHLLSAPAAVAGALLDAANPAPFAAALVDFLLHPRVRAVSAGGGAEGSGRGAAALALSAVSARSSAAQPLPPLLAHPVAAAFATWMAHAVAPEALEPLAPRLTPVAAARLVLAAARDAHARALTSVLAAALRERRPEFAATMLTAIGPEARAPHRLGLLASLAADGALPPCSSGDALVDACLESARSGNVEALANLYQGDDVPSDPLPLSESSGTLVAALLAHEERALESAAGEALAEGRDSAAAKLACEVAARHLVWLDEEDCCLVLSALRRRLSSLPPASEPDAPHAGENRVANARSLCASLRMLQLVCWVRAPYEPLEPLPAKGAERAALAALCSDRRLAFATRVRSAASRASTLALYLAAPFHLDLALYNAQAAALGDQVIVERTYLVCQKDTSLPSYTVRVHERPLPSNVLSAWDRALFPLQRWPHGERRAAHALRFCVTAGVDASTIALNLSALVNLPQTDFLDDNHDPWDRPNVMLYVGCVILAWFRAFGCSEERLRKWAAQSERPGSGGGEDPLPVLAALRSAAVRAAVPHPETMFTWYPLPARIDVRLRPPASALRLFGATPEEAARTRAYLAAATDTLPPAARAEAAAALPPADALLRASADSAGVWEATPEYDALPATVARAVGTYAGELAAGLSAVGAETPSAGDSSHPMRRRFALDGLEAVLRPIVGVVNAVFEEGQAGAPAVAERIFEALLRAARDVVRSAAPSEGKKRRSKSTQGNAQGPSALAATPEEEREAAVHRALAALVGINPLQRADEVQDALLRASVAAGTAVARASVNELAWAQDYGHAHVPALAALGALPQVEVWPVDDLPVLAPETLPAVREAPPVEPLPHMEVPGTAATDEGSEHARMHGENTRGDCESGAPSARGADGDVERAAVLRAADSDAPRSDADADSSSGAGASGAGDCGDADDDAVAARARSLFPAPSDPDSPSVPVVYAEDLVEVRRAGGGGFAVAIRVRAGGPCALVHKRAGKTGSAGFGTLQFVGGAEAVAAAPVSALHSAFSTHGALWDALCAEAPPETAVVCDGFVLKKAGDGRRWVPLVAAARDSAALRRAHAWDVLDAQRLLCAPIPAPTAVLLDAIVRAAYEHLVGENADSLPSTALLDWFRLRAPLGGPLRGRAAARRRAAEACGDALFAVARRVLDAMDEPDGRTIATLVADAAREEGAEAVLAPRAAERLAHAFMCLLDPSSRTDARRVCAFAPLSPLCGADFMRRSEAFLRSVTAGGDDGRNVSAGNSSSHSRGEMSAALANGGDAFDDDEDDDDGDEDFEAGGGRSEDHADSNRRKSHAGGDETNGGFVGSARLFGRYDPVADAYEDALCVWERAVGNGDPSVRFGDVAAAFGARPCVVWAPLQHERHKNVYDAADGKVLGYAVDSSLVDAAMANASTCAGGREDVVAWLVDLLRAPLPPAHAAWFAALTRKLAPRPPPAVAGLESGAPAARAVRVTAYCLAQRCPLAPLRDYLAGATRVPGAVLPFVERKGHGQYGVYFCDNGTLAAMRRAGLRPAVADFAAEYAAGIAEDEELYLAIRQRFGPGAAIAYVRGLPQISDRLFKWCAELTEQNPWRFVYFESTNSLANFVENRDRSNYRFYTVPEEEGSGGADRGTGGRGSGTHVATFPRSAALPRDDRAGVPLLPYDARHLARSKLVAEWEDEFNDAFEVARVILLVSPPGAGKTVFIRSFMEREDVRARFHAERIDGSSDVLVEVALADVLSDRFRTPGERALLVLDEYHMLADHQKMALARWVLPRLHWLKVVLIGNRFDEFDRTVLSHLERGAGSSRGAALDSESGSGNDEEPEHAVYSDEGDDNDNDDDYSDSGDGGKAHDDGDDAHGVNDDSESGLAADDLVGEASGHARGARSARSTDRGHTGGLGISAASPSLAASASDIPATPASGVSDGPLHGSYTDEIEAFEAEKRALIAEMRLDAPPPLDIGPSVPHTPSTAPPPASRTRAAASARRHSLLRRKRRGVQRSYGLTHVIHARLTVKKIVTLAHAGPLARTLELWSRAARALFSDEAISLRSTPAVLAALHLPNETAVGRALALHLRSRVPALSAFAAQQFVTAVLAVARSAPTDKQLLASPPPAAQPIGLLVHAALRDVRGNACSYAEFCARCPGAYAHHPVVRLATWSHYMYARSGSGAVPPLRALLRLRIVDTPGLPAVVGEGAPSPLGRCHAVAARVDFGDLGAVADALRRGLAIDWGEAQRAWAARFVTDARALDRLLSVCADPAQCLRALHPDNLALLADAGPASLARKICEHFRRDMDGNFDGDGKSTDADANHGDGRAGAQGGAAGPPEAYFAAAWFLARHGSADARELRDAGVDARSVLLWASLHGFHRAALYEGRDAAAQQRVLAELLAREATALLDEEGGASAAAALYADLFAPLLRLGAHRGGAPYALALEVASSQHPPRQDWPPLVQFLSRLLAGAATRAEADAWYTHEFWHLHASRAHSAASERSNSLPPAAVDGLLELADGPPSLRWQLRILRSETHVPDECVMRVQRLADALKVIDGEEEIRLAPGVFRDRALAMLRALGTRAALALPPQRSRILAEQRERFYMRNLRSITASARILQYYNVYAGVADLPAAELDKYKNPKGPKYDLGKDGAFRGFRVLIGHFYLGEGQTEDELRAKPGAALEGKGFTVRVVHSERAFVDALDDADVAWLMSAHEWVDPACTPEELAAAVSQFHKSGRGVAIFADNDPFYVQANAVLQSMCGARLVGDTPGEGVLERGDGSRRKRFGSHLVTSGLSFLYEGMTLAYPKPLGTLQVLATSSDYNPVICFMDGSSDGGRVLVDCAFTKLFLEWDSAGTARYVTNLTVWLLGIDERLNRGASLQGVYLTPPSMGSKIGAAVDETNEGTPDAEPDESVDEVVADGSVDA